MRAVFPVCLILAALEGCTFAHRVAEDPVAYNKSAAQARDRLLMLNVLRAADGYPMQFSALAQVRGNLVSEGTAGVESTFSEGGSSPVETGLSLGATFRSNPSFDVSILDSADFMKGILQPLDIGTLQSYSDQGWKARLLAYLLIEEIRITDPDDKSKVFVVPNEPRDHVKFDALLDQVLDAKPAPEIMEFDQKKILFEDHREVLAQGKLLKDDPILSLVARAIGPDDYSVGVTGEGKDVQLQLRRKEGKRIRSLVIESAADRTTASAFGGTRLDFDLGLVSLVMRSPQGALYYLGEVAELDEKCAAKLTVDGEPLFVVTSKRDEMDEHFRVSFRGQDRSIHKGSRNSRRAIALVAQLLAIHQSRSELPTTSLVNVVGR